MVEQYHKQGYEVVIIGHHGHPEVMGTAGRVAHGVHIVATKEEVEELQISDSEKVAYVTQTTLSQKDSGDILEILKEKFPKIKRPQEIKHLLCHPKPTKRGAIPGGKY